MIYEIAGLRVKMENRCRFTDEFCREYLSADQASPVDIKVKVTSEEFYAEKALGGNFPDGYVENICLYRAICRQLPVLERMLLHAAVLEYKGNAYAFLGRSGTGKSTHTGLWLKHLDGAKILNGDKPILAAREDGFTVYGTPWMGKERLGENRQAPLKGLCFLEQAKTNGITKLTPAEAASRIFVQVLLPEEEENAAKTLELIDRLVSEVPTYLLKCDISEEAVKLAYEALTGEEYPVKE